MESRNDRGEGFAHCKRCGKRMIAIEGREYGPVCIGKMQDIAMEKKK